MRYLLFRRVLYTVERDTQGHKLKNTNRKWISLQAVIFLRNRMITFMVKKRGASMGRKQIITQILIRAYTIRTVVLYVAETLWFLLAENSLRGLFRVMAATLILSLLSFAVSYLVSQEDRRISPSHAVLYAVFDVFIFSIGAGVFALMEMMGIQGGSGLAVVVIPILAGMVMLPFSIVLAVIAYRMIRQNITGR